MVFGCLFTIPETKPVTTVLPTPLRDLSDNTDPLEQRRSPAPVQERDDTVASCMVCYICCGLLAGYA